MTSLPMILEGLFFLSLFGFFLAFKFGYKKAIIENHRLKLFELRSQLYAMVQRYEIDPDTPAYRHTEKHINQLLRYSHTTTSLRMLFSMFVMKMGWYKPKNFRHYMDGVNSIPQADELDEDVLKTLVQIKRESMQAVTKFLPRYSPPWMIIRYLLIFYLDVKGKLKKSQRSVVDILVISRDYDFNSYNESRNNRIQKVSG